MTESKSEIKTQAVQELARDPNSNVASDDVQRVIVEESKKAGVPAFQFDPNATPEQKAAVAAAAIPPGLKREKNHGMGVVTDLVSLTQNCWHCLIRIRQADLTNMIFLRPLLVVLFLLWP